MIVFPEQKLSQVRISVRHEWRHNIIAGIFSKKHFPWESIQKIQNINEEDLPNWFVTGMNENKRRLGSFSEREIRKFLGLNSRQLIVPPVNRLEKETAETTNLSIKEEEKLSNNGVKFPEVKPTGSSTLNATIKDTEARKTLGSFVIPASDIKGWTISDDRIAKMVVMTSLAMAYFDGDNEDLRKQAKDSGMMMEFRNPVSDRYLDDICKYHENNKDGYGRYEESLGENANPIDKLIHEVNQECQNGRFPTVLGRTNLRKFCRLFLPKESCNYNKEIAANFECRTIGNQWSKDSIELFMYVDLPYEDYEFAVEGDPKYYYLKSMPIYSLNGYLKSQIPLPNDLILEVMADGGSRVFNGCERSVGSQTLWLCPTKHNIPGEFTKCLINSYNKIPGTCPGKISNCFINL